MQLPTKSARLLTMSLLAAVLLAAGSVDTPSHAVSAKVKQSCKGDYKRLCPKYKVGSPQLRACMEAKQYELSSGCVDALIDSGEVNRSSRR